MVFIDKMYPELIGSRLLGQTVLNKGQRQFRRGFKGTLESTRGPGGNNWICNQLRIQYYPLCKMKGVNMVCYHE